VKFTKVKTNLKRAMIGLMVLMQIAFFPAVTYAQEAQTDTSSDTTTTAPVADSDTPTPPVSEPTTPPADPSPDANQQTEQQKAASPPAQGPTTTPGPTSPPGADHNTFSYNPNTGLWENDLFTWDPVTHQTSPKTKQDFSYNPNTGQWDTTQWRYDAAAGKYVPNVVSSPQNPNNPAIMRLGIQSSASSDPDSFVSLADSVNATGPNSTNSVNLGSSNNGFFGGFYDASISNKLDSTAHSGNASVMQNTIAGNALTGNAVTMANLINLLQSSWNQDNGDLATFIANIDGDVVGDLTIDPGATGPSSTNNYTNNQDNNLKVVADGKAEITNDITLDASSGDASVSQNTKGGDATSGDAKAIANILNLINSSIASGHSFMGVLNINGNLDGDILMPDSMLSNLIASSTGPNSSNDVTETENNTLHANLTTNNQINNNVTASAESGKATVGSNTSAGSAKTGNADTKITLLNLTGRKVIAKDAVLVFVNVFGKWTGLIMDAPTGTTAAAITGPNSQNSTAITKNNNLDIDSTENNTITNNINVKAKTGDASVTENGTAGSATTGDAEAIVNIGNIVDSDFSLSDWFGVLFINVFGSWNGSFGVNTEAGNTKNAATAGSGTAGAGPNGFFGFIPTQAQEAAQTAVNSFNYPVSGAVGAGSGGTPAATLASAKKGLETGAQKAAVAPAKAAGNSPILMITAISMAAGIAMICLERLMTLVEKLRGSTRALKVK
jgi:hypothetical protein